MTEANIRVQSAAIRVDEATLESELAPLRTKIAKLQSEIALLQHDLQGKEEKRVALRLKEARLYHTFSEEQSKQVG